MTPDFRSGFVAVVGRPNVGKSTLVNAFLKQKVSIVSPKPQTTRHRVLGIYTLATHQIVFVDTPGLHEAGKKLINRTMNRVAVAAIEDADVMLFLLEALNWTEQDQNMWELLSKQKRPVIVVCNKIDRVKDKSRLLPFFAQLSETVGDTPIVPVSALKLDGLETLENLILEHLPLGPKLYPDEQVTDRDVKFQIAELIREKLTLRLQQELPYGVTVSIDQMQTEDQQEVIHATIWVEKPSQKSIVIGKQGAMLKEVGRSARLELKKKLGRSVHLELWVKIKDNWSDSARALESLGFEIK